MSIQVNCDICYETKPLASVRVLTTCGHAFCQTCIADVLRRSPNDRLCPNCRIRFRPHQVIQVFLQGPSIATSSRPLPPQPQPSSSHPRPPSPPPPPYSSLDPSDSVPIDSSFVPSSSIPSSSVPSSSIPTSSSSAIAVQVYPSQNEEEDDTDIGRLSRQLCQAFKKLNAWSSKDDVEAVVDDLLTLSGCVVSSSLGPGRADSNDAIHACLVGMSQFMKRISPMFTISTNEETRPGSEAGSSRLREIFPRRTIPEIQQLAANVTVTRANCFVKMTGDVDEISLRSTLSRQFGVIKEIAINRPAACAFVTFTTVDSARDAIIASLPLSQGGQNGICIGVGADAPRVRLIQSTYLLRSEFYPR